MIEDSRIITRLHRTYRCMPTLFFVRWIHDAELKPQEKLHFGSRKQQRLFSHCSLASYVKSHGLPYRPLSLSPSLLVLLTLPPHAFHWRIFTLPSLHSHWQIQPVLSPPAYPLSRACYYYLGLGAAVVKL